MVSLALRFGRARYGSTSHLLCREVECLGLRSGANTVLDGLFRFPAHWGPRYLQLPSCLCGGGRLFLFLFSFPYKLLICSTLRLVNAGWELWHSGLGCRWGFLRPILGWLKSSPPWLQSRSLYPGRQQPVARVPGPLRPTWETGVELLVSAWPPAGCCGR